MAESFFRFGALTTFTRLETIAEFAGCELSSTPSYYKNDKDDTSIKV
jgi:hypothetical protein